MSSATDFTWGVNVHQSYGLSMAQQLDLASTIGLTSLRIDVYDARPETIAWLSALVTEAGSRGISILPVIVPAAAACTSEAAARAWGLDVGSTLAAALPSLTWEAGNELDQFTVKPGTSGQSPSDYDDAGYSIARGAITGLVDGIHSADPGARVAVGIAGIDFGFLQRLATDGVKWDITSEHYYVAPGATDVAAGADSLFATLAQFHRPILMTEFNQQQGSLLSPSEQTATLVTMMDAMTALAPKYDIIGGYLYELLDEPRLGPAEAHYGLASGSGVLSAAGQGVQQYLAHVPGTPATPATPIVTARLVSDTGASSTDHITSNAALTGTADANSVVHFTLDGSAVAPTARADASGNWSIAATGLADGSNTVVVSETNSTGATGTASLGFTLQTHAPIPTFTGAAVSTGQASITGTTGEAGDTVSIYDGNTLIGSTTTGSDGAFAFTATGSSAVSHVVSATATSAAGLQGHSTGTLVFGSTGNEALTGTSGNDLISADAGNHRISGGAGADILTGGSGNATFTYKSASESTFAASDTVTDFRHGADKFDFTSIVGINAVQGVPDFQGNIGGTGVVALQAHSVAFMEIGGQTEVLVNTTGAAEAVSARDFHAANMVITLTGVHLGLTATDFHHY
jgi:Ca2+-binding RTX toxin-like protein